MSATYAEAQAELDAIYASVNATSQNGAETIIALTSARYLSLTNALRAVRQVLTNLAGVEGVVSVWMLPRNEWYRDLPSMMLCVSEVAEFAELVRRRPQDIKPEFRTQFIAAYNSRHYTGDQLP